MAIYYVSSDFSKEAGYEENKFILDGEGKNAYTDHTELIGLLRQQQRKKSNQT